MKSSCQPFSTPSRQAARRVTLIMEAPVGSRATPIVALTRFSTGRSVGIPWHADQLVLPADGARPMRSAAGTPTAGTDGRPDVRVTACPATLRLHTGGCADV